MAQSKTDPKRKENLQRYKDSLKQKTKKTMSQEQKSLPQIQQRPFWSSQEDIVLKGFEYEALVNVANIFRDAVQASESSLQRNINTGKVNVKYFDEKDNELTKEQVDEVTKLYASYFSQLNAGSKNAEKNQSGSDGQATKSLLVGSDGEPIASESPLRVV